MYGQTKVTLRRWPALLAGALLTLAGAGHAEDVYFNGTLLADACTIAPGDEEVELDFRNVVDKFLYRYNRIPSETFEIRLTDCDLTLGNLVKVVLSGNESPILPGLLALDGGSVASGIAIGLETATGVALPLNTGEVTYPLAAGTNLLRLKAYIQGEPAALASKTIGLGPFTATATFTLEYE